MKFLKVSLLMILIIMTSSCFAKFYTFAIPVHPWQSNMTKSQIMQAYMPLKDYLEKSTGMKFKLVGYFDDITAVNNLEANRYDIVYTKVFPYLLAKKRNPNISTLATVLTWNADHSKKILSYTGYIITRKSDQNIHSIHDLKGKTIGFVDRFSASGFLYPVSIMKELGINYKTFFKTFRFYDTHLRVLQALQNNKIDAGAIWGTQWKMVPYKNAFKPILIMHNIPNPSIVASGTLSLKQKQQLTDALIHAPKKVFEHLLFVGFEKTPPTFYHRIHSLPAVEKEMQHH